MTQSKNEIKCSYCGAVLNERPERTLADLTYNTTLYEGTGSDIDRYDFCGRNHLTLWLMVEG